MRPRVAVSCDVTLTEPPKLTVHLAYVDYLTRLGVTPMVLPPSLEALAWLDVVDGVLLVGGDDYRLGNTQGTPADFVAVAERREHFDIALARELLDRDVPVLGVCGGFQLLALVGGGAIYGDLPTEAPPSSIRHRRASADEPLAVHSVQWSGPVGFDGGLRAGTYRVNSHHHQAVRVLPGRWQTLAASDDGVIEAARGPGAFQVGVQWHPERATGCALSDGVARAFVAAAATHASRRRKR